MKIIVPANTVVQDKRVALAPEHIPSLTALGFEIWFENCTVPFSVDSYKAQGVKWTDDKADLCRDAALLLSVGGVSSEILNLLPRHTRIVGLLGGKTQAELYKDFFTQAYALELLPRISRAQFMDVLSSQAALMGYWAVIQVASRLPRILPMMTTAAGTLFPAQILVLGAGVAGLQAIGMGRRLGAKISACDVRAKAQEQVESLGAKFLHLPGIQDGEGSGGYARALTVQEQRAQQEFLKTVLPSYNAVICSALVHGGDAPLLLTKEMLSLCQPGTVIVDLATHLGALGNCDFTQAGKGIRFEEVTTIGAFYPLSDLAVSASLLYGKNLLALINLLWNAKTKCWTSPKDDPLLEAMCITE
ncbi:MULTISPECIES: Rossmann-fold NAD(P)-binding domain-containing protein [Holospora]|uniref:proton-translocating NAD(P)(+) transhydrogenase n=2 Tax=Holospora TaxID=44747 RepID=A0A061JFZ5_9PROT|nr:MULTISPECIES: NAD(P)(+) transhydrogenase [Holospora]ETZ04726.1 NAD(P) transhydrogenase subunit alpha part 1 [Holospora undulata HU1]GAJ46452.1 NAD(P) transhydrogenase subunit alpha part 1 [Holospora elegans E1]